MTEEPIKDSIISISQLRHAQVCIDEAINACEAQHNSGIDAGAIHDFKNIMKNAEIWEPERWSSTEKTYTFGNIHENLELLEVK